MSLRLLCSIHFQAILLFFIVLLHAKPLAVLSVGNETDHQALLAFKTKITHDPTNVFSSWNDSFHFCEWEGVTCGRKHRRVTVLDLQSRGLVGSLSPYIGNLSFIREIVLENNTIGGKIPDEVGRLFRLRALKLNNNSLEGEIPANLSYCSNLKTLNIVKNNLSGSIPMELASLSKLEHLRAWARGVIERRRQQQSAGVRRCGEGRSGGGPVVATGLRTSQQPAGVSAFGARCTHTARRSEDADEMDFFQSLANCSNLQILSLNRNQFKGTLPNVLGNLSTQLTTFGINENLIFGEIPSGIGSNSIILELLQECIKASLGEDGSIVAVKALVYEFMPNGSLENWLHMDLETDNGHVEIQNLSLLQRTNIAIDVACALDYLHHHCLMPVVHCDLKPSNILFDCDMTAHVGDFGLAKFLLELTNPKQSSSIGIRGTIGYTPPEYGLGSVVSTKGDVYSYGILLLEMITGKRPTDSVFEGGLNLHNYAVMALPDRVMEIVDPKLLNNVDEVIANHNSSPTNINEGVFDIHDQGRSGMLCGVAARTMGH
uniref:non-specific serine/threonine protein kinase n=1 Tax=Fagus sylvatica TaxID=28930 RepID=A0A2N9GDF6_FAGSY